ncbi:hypothetical protein [Ramlibacter rhizophilus]|uniref:Uncharacterized protein n=1 Tax=Ramlibacter rhizophilus TaxID=1781167 RepID=A0A4Z0BVP5_9BURK|nr:hypothetical protein [Ramlibacter rhizophilus]TFZ03386.1 hypothetical protein EZ242_05750 [Ramlibacter rhizophilus]
MSFKLRTEVDDWFSRIYKAKDSPLSTKFDYYYLCLMMGFSRGKATPVTNAVEFVQNFVLDYRSVQSQIIGLLIATEARALGIELTNRARIKDLLSRYVSPEASVALTPKGFERLNDYANGGFNAIVASYPEEQPWIASDFMQWYQRAISAPVS